MFLLPRVSTETVIGRHVLACPHTNHSGAANFDKRHTNEMFVQQHL